MRYSLGVGSGGGWCERAGWGAGVGWDLLGASGKWVCWARVVLGALLDEVVFGFVDGALEAVGLCLWSLCW